MKYRDSYLFVLKKREYQKERQSAELNNYQTKKSVQWILGFLARSASSIAAISSAAV
jgi:hypothetical protein